MTVNIDIEIINLFQFSSSTLCPLFSFTPFPQITNMLRKAMVGMAIVGLSAVDAYSVLQKRDGAHAHDHGHAAPAPSDGYAEPAASYGAPSPSYGEPAASYGEPQPSYGEPAPTYGAEEAALPDLTPIIIGILALIGLSLLFPTFVSVTARRKRSAAEGKNSSTMLVWALPDKMYLVFHGFLGLNLGLFPYSFYTKYI